MFSSINMTGDTVHFAPLREGESGGTPVPAPAPAPAPAAWTTGLDADLVGHAQNRGWDKLTPDKAAQEALKAHREASKMIGVPEARLIRLPVDATDEAGWGQVWNRLGAPKEAKEYDFSNVKFADGKPLEKSFEDALRADAFRNHLPKDAATAVAKSLVKIVDDGDKAEAAEATAKFADEQKKLVADWGPANVETNYIIAKAAAAKLGPEFEQAAKDLEGKVGFAGVMKLFHKIGTAIGEDSFIKNLNGGGSPVLTKEQATARRQELQGDKDWSKRYIEGGAAEGREMKALIAIERQDAPAAQGARR